jgi:prevent-host-death family protein
MKTMGISEFKATCIEALKTVQQTGEPLLVTRRNRPIATVVPYSESPASSELGKLRGRMKICGDIVHTDFDAEWEMDRWECCSTRTCGSGPRSHRSSLGLPRGAL